MPAPDEIIQLVARFREQYDSYRSPSYNETQVRREFVDPLFRALGWDVDNQEGYAEAYKEVIHEDSIKIGGSTKAPDYSFRIGGVRKFFVETKKPSVNIHKDAEPAYQLRRYAWSAKLPLSILTDFEELAVYDCRIRPEQKDKASKARTLYYTYDQYEAKWDEIAAIFSKEAILKGSFDKYAQSNKKKRGTAEVDAAFLDDIESWRHDLAKNIARANPELSQRELNTAVQKTIDRIIFLRICEDRGIERYGLLQSLLNGKQVYPRLTELFQKADHRYNSGLFHFEKETGRTEPPDAWTLRLKIDDRVLKGILRQLYYPESPYEFSVLSADILGQVYEQFLGKVIRLTKGHQAKVEDKPEVKKAGGVYYTPTYIVDYIVEQTVGKLIEGKQPHEVAGRTKSTWKPAKGKLPISVLDPACGSGSFLIGAYQYLLDWYRDWYVNHTPKKWKGRLYQTRSEKWRLTGAERKRILLDHIYGVDIDSQAVEVTKLSLLLKVLEGETDASLFDKERALPDLSENIKCGNSLIGPDFYQSVKQLDLFDEEERLRINVFDWQAEFAEIMTRGGFDAVIGNPPFIDSEWMTHYLRTTREYCGPRYIAAAGNWDMFCVFIEKALTLCREGCLAGFIVPNKLGSAKYAEGARTVLTTKNTLRSIRDYSHVPVFPVSVYPIVYVATRGYPQEQTAAVTLEKMRSSQVGEPEIEHTHHLAYNQYFSNPSEPWQIFATIGATSLIKKLQRHPPIKDHMKVLGAATVSEAYEIQELIENGDARSAKDLRLVNSGTIDRYSCLWGVKKCRYLGCSLLSPIVSTEREDDLPHKRAKQARTPKIIVAGMTKNLECIADANGSILAGKSTTIILGDYNQSLLLGILNSRLISFYYVTIYGGNKLQGGYLRIGRGQLGTIPIPTDPSSKSDKVPEIIDAVKIMEILNGELRSAKTSHEKTALQRQIDATDRQIDQLVYELYGLTDKEIRLVEEATAK